ncbi:MAG: MFS transporter [Propionibacteriaceae bacterium]|jgi:OFA family oxalate/formate antiporter-like MFS transporter|nr:MFS transporter [Propionibacteriaceae bacterium]
MDASRVKYHFGFKGGAMIAYSGLLVYFMTGLTVDGLNIVVPGLAALKGWDADQLLAIATPASMVALVLTSLWSFVIRRIGLKKATTLALFLAAFSLVAFANSVNTVMYFATETLMITFINCFSVIGGYAMLANWFPRKKGLVLGFATMGMNFASASIPYLLTKFGQIWDPRGNVTHALYVFAGIVAVVGVFNHGLVKDTPEAAGCFPDNEPDETGRVGAPETPGDAGLTYLQVLKLRKTWIVGITYGVSGMANVGIMSQMVVFLTGSRGYEQMSAIGMMSVAALIGVVGSYLWGVVDQKWGTRFAMQCYGIWYAIAIVMLVTPSTLMVGIVMIGVSIGGNANFQPSMTVLCYGRHSFATAQSVVNMLVGVIRSFAFVILAALRSATGSATGAYIAFIGTSLTATALVSLLKKKDYAKEIIEV